MRSVYSFNKKVTYTILYVYIELKANTRLTPGLNVPHNVKMRTVILAYPNKIPQLLF